ncbi:MAG: radical SAM/SPASM domain-containing protein [Candidatus Omnitrophota bacterium]
MKLINPEIRFEVTNRCNARCIMCPRDKMKRPQGVLDMALYKRVLDEACEYGATQVSLENYGESFLDPFIFERAEYAKSKGMKVFTITNGSIMDAESAAKMAGLFDKIRVSMYAVTKETYESIHKGLDFETVRGNVETLLTTRRAVKSGLRIEMYFLLLDENRHEMDAFLKTYEPRVDAVSVWKPHNWSDGRAYRERAGRKVSCGRPFTGPVQVQWDGLAVPCCFDYDSRIVLGDFNKETLKDILKGEKYERLRRAHASGNFGAYPFCDSCDQLHKRADVLVYTNIKNSKVGATNTAYFDLEEEQKKEKA